MPAGGARVPAPFQPRMQSGFREAAASGAPVSRRTVSIAVAAGVLLLVAGIGAAGAMTRYGPFFWKVFRGHGDPAVARLAAEGRAALALDAFPSDEKARELAEQGLARRADDPQGIRLLASAAAALAPRGADAILPRARQLSGSLLAEEPASLGAQEARVAVALAAGEDATAPALALEKLLPAEAESRDALPAGPRGAGARRSRQGRLLPRSARRARAGLSPIGAAPRRGPGPARRREGGPRAPRGGPGEGPAARGGVPRPRRPARPRRRSGRGGPPPGAPRQGPARPARTGGTCACPRAAGRHPGSPRRPGRRRGRAGAGHEGPAGFRGGPGGAGPAPAPARGDGEGRAGARVRAGGQPIRRGLRAARAGAARRRQARRRRQHDRRGPRPLRR